MICTATWKSETMTKDEEAELDIRQPGWREFDALLPGWRNPPVPLKIEEERGWPKNPEPSPPPDRGLYADLDRD
jgi:hypothetical protein